MASAKTKNRKTSRSRSNGRPVSIQESLVRHLSAVPGIEAIFITTEENVIHVFSVTKDHRAGVYGKLMEQEARVERDHPGKSFDFHTREHQGRPPSRAVPHGAELVFSK